VLALSVWEVEIGRFGRMYAPFQCLFLWYVVFFLQYVIDGRRRAAVPMVILSALGLAVWDGGILLVMPKQPPPRRTPDRPRCAVSRRLFPAVDSSVLPDDGGLTHARQRHAAGLRRAAG